MRQLGLEAAAAQEFDENDVIENRVEHPDDRCKRVMDGESGWDSG